MAAKNEEKERNDTEEEKHWFIVNSTSPGKLSLHLL